MFVDVTFVVVVDVAFVVVVVVVVVAVFVPVLIVAVIVIAVAPEAVRSGSKAAIAVPPLAAHSRCQDTRWVKV
jgi:hypothetical protein